MVLEEILKELSIDGIKEIIKKYVNSLRGDP